MDEQDLSCTIRLLSLVMICPVVFVLECSHTHIQEDGRDMNASISLSIKLNMRLMLVGLPAWRKTERQKFRI